MRTQPVSRRGFPLRFLSLPAILLLVAWSAVSSTAQAATQLIRVPAAAPGLTELGLALDHVARAGDEVILAASEWDLNELKAAGIPYVTVIADLEQYYASRLASERPLRGDVARGFGSGTGFGFGSMGGYYTFAEVVAKLDEMRADYPQLVTAKQSLGLSHLGRDVWMVKISDNPETNENEPEMLYTSVTHAREPQGMMLLIYAMFYLLENYGTDPEATYLVNERELYFVPVVNPDGYVHNQTTNPNGGGMWRKNRRNNGGGIFGVDLNRNYGYNWGINNEGSSGNPSSDTYRGPSAFSEPETQAIRQFHQGRTIWTAFHYHTFGNYEIHPFGLTPTSLPPEPDRSLYAFYGSEIAAMNGYDVGNTWATVGYAVNGDAVDWSYGEQVEKNKIFAFTPEVGNQSDGFWPPSSRIFPLAEENLGPNLYWAWIAGARTLLVATTADPEVPAGGSGEVSGEVTNFGLGAAANDVTLTLATGDAFVTIPDPEIDFPSVPSLESVNNADDPLVYNVSPAAPNGHIIQFNLTMKQGPVVRGQSTFQVTVTGSAGVPGGAESPAISHLALKATPNPMGRETALVAGLPAAAPAEIAIMDVAGRVRRILWTAPEATEGEHRITFDGRDAQGSPLPNGVYLAELKSRGERAHVRLVILR
jgi:Zinc carboxypeptidase/FlgD Ig-like domain